MWPSNPISVRSGRHVDMLWLKSDVRVDVYCFKGFQKMEHYLLCSFTSAECKTEKGSRQWDTKDSHISIMPTYTQYNKLGKSCWPYPNYWVKADQSLTRCFCSKRMRKMQNLVPFWSKLFLADTSKYFQWSKIGNIENWQFFCGVWMVRISEKV